MKKFELVVKALENRIEDSKEEIRRISSHISEVLVDLNKRLDTSGNFSLGILRSSPSELDIQCTRLQEKEATLRLLVELEENK